MSYTYAQYFDILDYELRQESEGGDKADDDAYRDLPSDQAERIINETIKKYAGYCPDRFEQELTITFKDSPTANDISEAISGTTYTAPDQIMRIIAIKNSNKWSIVGDSSDLSDSFYSPSNRVIENSDSWSEDDTLIVKAVVFPLAVMTASANITLIDDVDIPFPDEYIRMLTLDVKRQAYARKGNGLSQYDYSELKEYEKRWQSEKGRVLKKQYMAFRGHSFGR